MKQTIIQIICIVTIVFMIPVAVYAQDSSRKNLHFVYIDHEISTPVSRLCQRLQSFHNDALEVGDVLVIYLSDNQHPFYSFTNLKDATDQKRDSKNAFNSIIEALQNSNSHAVSARDDRHFILNLFEDYNFVDDSGQLLYQTVTFDFYVGSSFWMMGNNEKIIAHLFVAFNAASYTRDKFAFNIYKPREVQLNYQEDMPFGDNDIDGINNKLSVFEY